MNKPKYLITIVTICYNVAEDLAKTIESVRTQTYTNIEYIIVDGGSKDHTLEVIKKNKDIIAKYVSEPDKGIYDAMNKGIGFATGDWILFMNAGDVFHSNNVVEELFKRDYSLDTAIVYGDVVQDYGDCGKLIKSLHRFDSNNVARQLCHQAMITRADVLKRITYDTSFKIMADINSFVIIQKMGYKFEYIPLLFSVFEVTGGVSSTKPMLMTKESLRIRGIEKFSLDWFKSYLRAFSILLLLRILPTKVYNRIRFKKMSANKLYWPQ